MTLAPWQDVLDAVLDTCARQGRPDLARELGRLRARLADPGLRVLVVGEPNHGKSQLVNALVNAPVCAVGDDVSTTAATVVRYADEPSAVLVGPSTRTPVRVNELATRTGHGAAEVGLPRRLLAGGLVLVDAPPGEEPRDADVVVLATQASGELTAAELDLLRRASTWCPEIVVAQTKIDLTPHWRETARRNRALLAEAGVPATLLPVSAALRLHAAGADDQPLNAESGFADLVRHLRTTAAAKTTGLAHRAAALAVHHAATQLVDALRGRVKAGHGAAAARCQTLLADDFADLTADLDFDLRDRARRILREIDAAFDDADPATQWSEFDEWLHDQLTAAADANFSWLLQRCQWTADKIAHDFPRNEAVSTEDSWAHPDTELGRPRWDEFTLSQRAFTGLRGSYGGVLMFGLVTSLTIGLPLFNPISLGAGLLFGGKSIHEEGENRLRRRQAAARSSAQRHVDDFFLRYGRDSRATVRQIQRGLRDHIAGVTAEGERHQREIRHELERLTALHARMSSGPRGITA